MTQTARPTSDITEGSWTPTPLWPQVGAITPNTTTPVDSSNNPSNDTFEVKLSSGLALPSSGPQTLTVQLGQSGTGDLPVSIALVQGTQIIAAQIAQPTQSFTNQTLTLSQQQINQITNYSDLRVRVDAGVTTHGTCATAAAIPLPAEGSFTTTAYTAVSGQWWGVFSSIGDTYTAAAATGVTVTAYRGSCSSLTQIATGTTSITFNTNDGDSIHIKLSGSVTSGTLTLTDDTPP